MNEITTTETDVQIARENAAFEMLQRQAKMFSSSSLVPKEFQGNLANCAIGIDIAKRLGASPFMVLQNIDIIHGRPSFRATFLIAMVNAAGRFEPLQFKMEGDEGKPNRSCIAWTKSKPDGATLEGPKITLEMAKAEGWSTKNGSKWITMPELMLRYRAAAFFARLYAPDITLGMMTAEEVADTVERDVTPKAETSKLFQPKTPALEDCPQPPPFKSLTQSPAKSPQTAASPEHSRNGYQAPSNEAAESFQEVALIDSPAVSLADQIKAKLDAAKLKWSDVLTKLQSSGIGGEEFTPLELTDEDTLKSAIELWAGIEAAIRKETK